MAYRRPAPLIAAAALVAVLVALALLVRTDGGPLRSSAATKTPTPAAEEGADSASVPAAPTGVTATAGNGSVTVSWTNPGDASITRYEYQMRAAPPAPGWGARIAVPGSSASTTSFTVTGLTNGTEYRFKVRAVNKSGESLPGPYAAPWYVAATPAPPPPVPAAPTGVTATAGDGSVTVSWTNPGDATITRYEYQQRAAPPAPGWGARIAVPGSGAATTSFTVTGLTNGTEYRFKVRAVNAGGESQPGPYAAPWYVAATPAAPPPPCEHSEGTLSADATITGSWVATCQSAELKTTTAGYSMFHSFTLSARRMVTIGLASSAGDAELVLRKGSGRTGVTLEEDDDGGTGTNARVRLPLDAATYTIEAKVKASAAGAYTLTIGLVTPPVMTYPTFDTTGNTATAGSYSILTTASSGGSGQSTHRAVTTYEELRTSASTVRLNLNDSPSSPSASSSHSTFYATVEVGDVVEWRKASDCWTRYQVTSATAPGSGATSREFGVKWVTYAYSGCSGTLPGTLAATVSWYPLTVTSIAIAAPSEVATTPIRHGPTLQIPRGWMGTLEAPESIGSVPAKPVVSRRTESLAVARTYPHWSEPELPQGWTFWKAAAGGGYLAPEYGYEARYVDAQGTLAVTISVTPIYGTTYQVSGADPRVHEVRVIDGHPARVKYNLPTAAIIKKAFVLISDESARLNYIVFGYHPILTGDIDAAIAIARSLYRKGAQ